MSVIGDEKAPSSRQVDRLWCNAHGIIIDELHAQPNRDLVDVLTTSTGARRQPLVIHITTTDFDRGSICNEKYDYARKVRDGIIDDPAFLRPFEKAVASFHCRLVPAEAVTDNG